MSLLIHLVLLTSVVVGEMRMNDANCDDDTRKDCGIPISNENERSRDLFLVENLIQPLVPINIKKGSVIVVPLTMATYYVNRSSHLLTPFDEQEENDKVADNEVANEAFNWWWNFAFEKMAVTGNTRDIDESKHIPISWWFTAEDLDELLVSSITSHKVLESLNGHFSRKFCSSLSTSRKNGVKCLKKLCHGEDAELFELNELSKRFQSLERRIYASKGVPNSDNIRKLKIDELVSEKRKLLKKWFHTPHRRSLSSLFVDINTNLNENAVSDGKNNTQRNPSNRSISRLRNSMVESLHGTASFGNDIVLAGLTPIEMERALQELPTSASFRTVLGKNEIESKSSPLSSISLVRQASISTGKTLIIRDADGRHPFLRYVALLYKFVLFGGSMDVGLSLYYTPPPSYPSTSSRKPSSVIPHYDTMDVVAIQMSGCGGQRCGNGKEWTLSRSSPSYHLSLKETPIGNLVEDGTGIESGVVDDARPFVVEGGLKKSHFYDPRIHDTVVNYSGFSEIGKCVEKDNKCKYTNSVLPYSQTEPLQASVICQATDTYLPCSSDSTSPNVLYIPRGMIHHTSVMSNSDMDEKKSIPDPLSRIQGSVKVKPLDGSSCVGEPNIDPTLPDVPGGGSIHISVGIEPYSPNSFVSNIATLIQAKIRSEFYKIDLTGINDQPDAGCFDLSSSLPRDVIFSPPSYTRHDSVSLSISRMFSQFSYDDIEFVEDENIIYTNATEDDFENYDIVNDDVEESINVEDPYERLNSFYESQRKGVRRKKGVYGSLSQLPFPKECFNEGQLGILLVEALTQFASSIRLLGLRKAVVLPYPSKIAIKPHLQCAMNVAMRKRHKSILEEIKVSLSDLYGVNESCLLNDSCHPNYMIGAKRFGKLITSKIFTSEFLWETVPAWFPSSDNFANSLVEEEFKEKGILANGSTLSQLPNRLCVLPASTLISILSSAETPSVDISSNENAEDNKAESASASIRVDLTSYLTGQMISENANISSPIFVKNWKSNKMLIFSHPHLRDIVVGKIIIGALNSLIEEATLEMETELSLNCSVPVVINGEDDSFSSKSTNSFFTSRWRHQKVQQLFQKNAAFRYWRELNELMMYS
eukprot:Tbor_TRINITY_DN3396_c0_g1::TRINITY_DN3396_c0_g1_i1::g.23557::m.23557